MILGIDLGNKCGIAFAGNSGERTYMSEIHAFDKKKMLGFKKKTLQAGVRYSMFKRVLIKILSVDKQNKVFYEDVRRHLGTQAAHVYGGYLAILQMVCAEHSIALNGIPVGTIKKHATGNGRATKQMMIDAAREKLNYKGNDDNEADALWILDAGIALHL